MGKDWLSLQEALQCPHCCLLMVVPCPLQPASRDQVVSLLDKARTVMPAKPAAPAKSGGVKGSAEPSRAASGGWDASSWVDAASWVGWTRPLSSLQRSSENLCLRFSLQVPG